MAKVNIRPNLELGKLPPRGTGLRMGTAGPRRFGQPRTEAERMKRHKQVVKK